MKGRFYRLSSLKIHSIIQQFQARWAKGCQQSCCESRKKMSIFESVIAKFNQALITPSWQKKLVQICSLVDENMVIFKDKNEILNVKGPFHVLLTEKVNLSLCPGKCSESGFQYFLYMKKRYVELKKIDSK